MGIDFSNCLTSIVHVHPFPLISSPLAARDMQKKNQKGCIFLKKYFYCLLISRTLFTRITSFPENCLCYGLKCVTEGRFRLPMLKRVKKKKKCRLPPQTRRLSLRTSNTSNRGKVKVHLFGSRHGSKSFTCI